MIRRFDDGKHRFQNKCRVFQNEFVLVEKLLAFQGSLCVIDLSLEHFLDRVTGKWVQINDQTILRPQRGFGKVLKNF